MISFKISNDDDDDEGPDLFIFAQLSQAYRSVLVYGHKYVKQ